MMSHNIEPLVDCTTSGFILDENNKYFKKLVSMVSVNIFAVGCEPLV